jgi:UDP-glucose 4-epimerase
MSTVLVTGFAGGLAQRVAERLVDQGHNVVGVDYRLMPPPTGKLAAVRVHRASYHKTAIEDVFRWYPFDAVFHLGREGNLREGIDLRFDLNVVGSQKLLALCVQHRVQTAIVLSTFHIYGAHPRNHVPISEDDPLRAGADFPEISDAIQLDGLASTFCWKHPALRTVVLRPTNVVGPSLNNTMSKFLRLRAVPYLVGFDPMVQFLHEADLADAIVAAWRGDARGVFNVVGDTAIPWRTALELTGARAFPLPSSLAARAGALLGFPAYLVNFYRYPCVLTDRAFRSAFGWAPALDVEATLRTTVAEARALQRRGA